MEPLSALSTNFFQTKQHHLLLVSTIEIGKANDAGHENSKDRRDAMIFWITRKSTANTIDRVLKTQYETERQY